MSEIKVNKISPRSGTDVTLGDSSDTITVPTGVGLTVTDEVKTNKISPATGVAFALGDSGDTFTVPSGATLANLGTATGFAGIAWQSVVTGATLTAVAGRGYPINTTSNACTVTLPGTASVGDQIIFTDYARKWGTNAVTLDQGSLKYQSKASNPVYNTDGESLHIVYVDVTQGWIPLYDGTVAYASNPTYNVEYLVIAGGGGGGYCYTGGYYSGGGGGGGYRNSYASENSGKNSSTESVASVSLGETYTCTVGGGGAVTSNGLNGVVGDDSSLIGTGVSITSAGGGYGQGGNDSVAQAGGAGGCGGGAADGVQFTSSVGGAGTTAQGYDGGAVVSNDNGAAGGGGAGAVAANYSGTNMAGGAGLASNITDSSVTRSAGGMGSKTAAGTTKTANTGDGGDGTNCAGAASAGASGVVILRMLTANYTGTITGSPTVSTVGSETVLIYTGTGTYVA